MRVQFNESQRIDVLEMITIENKEYIPRLQLLESMDQSPEIKQSPSISKNQGKKAQQQRQKEEEARRKPPQAFVPRSAVGEWGLPNGVLEFLEVSALPMLDI